MPYRTIRHHAVLSKYHASVADHREDPLIPVLPKQPPAILYGSWEDISREYRFRNQWKDKRLHKRRISRKLKLRVFEDFKDILED